MNEKDKARPISPTKANREAGRYNSESKGNEIIDADELHRAVKDVLMNAYYCHNCGFIAVFMDLGNQVPDHRCPFCTNDYEEWIMLKVEELAPEPIINAEEVRGF